MTKQELQRAIEAVQAACKAQSRGFVINTSGLLWSEGISFTPHELVSLLTEGHERRRHEELVEAVGESHLLGTRIADAIEASKQALAEGE